MDDLNTGRGKVLIVSEKESFLASSLVQKLDASGTLSMLSHGNIKEIDGERDNIELVILFLTEDMEGMEKTLVYLKDMVNDLDRKIIIIGCDDEYKEAAGILSEDIVLERFKRPLVMDDLLKCIVRYMEENSGENRKKTILIVDDDITYMRTVYEWLKDSYHVGMAASGVQAISYLAKNRADLILLDYEMPIADGPQVLKMLNADSQTDSIPVMFLTGHGDTQSVLSVVSLCPVDYLLKTIDKQGLLKKLDDFFKSKK
ncbi:MAG: response regulator [Lachnospiraceae bacterium]|nr:response regulator [Lachnospiraceae bacterium]